MLFWVHGGPKLKQVQLEGEIAPGRARCEKSAGKAAGLGWNLMEKSGVILVGEAAGMDTNN